MDGHGVGHVQLAQQVRRVHADPVVEADGHQLAGGIDVLHRAHVAVEDAAAGLAAVLLPDHIVVVPGLHDPVPYPEHHVAPGLLALAGGRGIQRRLQGAVQADGAGLPLTGGGEHLDLSGGNAHIFRQAGAAQVHHRLHQPVRRPAAQEKEVVLLVFQIRGPAPVHRMGVADDGGLLRLAEYLRQGHRRH